MRYSLGVSDKEFPGFCAGHVDATVSRVPLMFLLREENNRSGPAQFFSKCLALVLRAVSIRGSPYSSPHSVVPYQCTYSAPAQFPRRTLANGVDTLFTRPNTATNKIYRSRRNLVVMPAIISRNHLL